MLSVSDTLVGLLLSHAYFHSNRIPYLPWSRSLSCGNIRLYFTTRRVSMMSKLFYPASIFQPTVVLSWMSRHRFSSLVVLVAFGCLWFYGSAKGELRPACLLYKFYCHGIYFLKNCHHLIMYLFLQMLFHIVMLEQRLLNLWT